MFISTRLKPILDETGKVIAVIGVSRDLTERLYAEESLQVIKENHLLFFVNAPIGIIHYNNKGIISDVNDAMIATFGSSRDKLLGLDIGDIPDKKFSKEIYKTLDGEHGYYEGLYVSYTGKKNAHIKSDWIPIIDDDKVVGGVGIVEDITERKKTEEALKESEFNLRSLFNAMTDVVLEINYEGRYINIAPTSPDLLYKPADEILGKTLHEVFPKPEADKFLELVQTCLDKNKTIKIEYPLKIKDKISWFEGRATPKSKDTILYIAHDISERKKAEEELKKHRENLEEMIKERTKELVEKNKELDNALKVFVGRELTIRDLQKRIRAFEGR